MKQQSHCLLHPLLFLALSLGLPADAQEHKAHVHGTSTLLVAVEADELVVEFAAPADDIVGFEHAPKNEAQEHQVDAALAVLKTPAQMFQLPPAAGCALEAVQVLEAIHGDTHAVERRKADDHAHDEKTSGKAGGKHDEEEEGHGGFRLRYHFHCSASDKLAGFELLMFARFPRMHKVQAQVISARGQKSVTLDHDHPRLIF